MTTYLTLLSLSMLVIQSILVDQSRAEDPYDYDAARSRFYRKFSPPTVRCPREADVVFVLDESSSIKTYEFKAQKIFLKDLVDQFDISPKKTQIGIEAFGTNARTIVNIGEINEAEKLKNTIDGLEQKGIDTYTNKALERLREMFSNSYRPGVQKMAIIITDGESTEHKETIKEAQKVHNQGITVFAIGVGNYSMSELREIATQPGYVFTVTNYGKLNEILSDVASMTCKENGNCSCPRPKPPTIFEGCYNSMIFNLYLGIPDQLSSIDTELVLQFIRQVTILIRGTSSIIRPYLVPRICLPPKIFGDDDDSYDFVNFLSTLDHRKSESVTQCDFQIQYILTQEDKYRRRYPFGKRSTIAVLLVDNRLVNLDLVQTEIALAKQEGIQIVTIGVGDQVNQDELLKIATADSDFIWVRNYKELSLISDVLIQRICVRGLVLPVKLASV